MLVNNEVTHSCALRTALAKSYIILIKSSGIQTDFSGPLNSKYLKFFRQNYVRVTNEGEEFLLK